MIKAVFFDLGDTLISEEGVGGVSLRKAKLEKVPHVDSVLGKLKEKYRLGLITNTTTSREEDVRWALHKIGIVEYFDVIVTSVDAESRKPDERIFQIALDAIGVKATEAVMIGNRILRDVLGGNKMGMKTILFRWNERYPDRVTSPQERPTRIIESLKDLPKVLEELEREF
ncbi:MAG: HAD family hydrolase [Promethearchaeota archaeon]